MKRVWLNKLYILKTSVKWTGIVFSFLGIASTFTSLSDLLDPSITPIKRLLISALILFSVWLVTVIVASIYVANKNQTQIIELNNNHHVYIQYGDIFSENEVKNPTERRNIVIPVNRCFDTIIDDDLVSSATLHGKVMNRLYNNGLYNQTSLNNEIQKSLNKQNEPFTQLTNAQKRNGNLLRYNSGAMAEVKESDKCTYFFLGLTCFDYNLVASVSDEEYVYAIVRMIKYCNQRSQQFPVVMPLIGGGLSRTGKTEKEILEFFVKTLNMHKSLINCDIHIVVRDSGRGSIPILDI